MRLASRSTPGLPLKTLLAMKKGAGLGWTFCIYFCIARGSMLDKPRLEFLVSLGI